MQRHGIIHVPIPVREKNNIFEKIYFLQSTHFKKKIKAQIFLFLFAKAESIATSCFTAGVGKL